MRSHTLKNFASHSQPLLALSEMGFWSKKTIVEDGHQYWRSLFFFKGNYEVLPIHVAIYQDAVMEETLIKDVEGAVRTASPMGLWSIGRGICGGEAVFKRQKTNWKDAIFAAFC